MNCPRRNDGFANNSASDDTWRNGSSCSYCGSLHPGIFLARVAEGTVEVGPTDKNYKVYVHNHGGADPGSIKFYFEHLSESEKLRFIDLCNEDKVLFGAPGYFYSLPFFMSLK